MESINATPTWSLMTTTQTNNTNTSTIYNNFAFWTSAEMEAHQKAFFNLRILKSNEDDQSEAFYRRSIYATYNKALGVLSTTTTSTEMANKRTQHCLIRLDDELQVYYHLLYSMERHSDSASLSQCLDTMERITIEFDESMTQLFVRVLADLLNDLVADQNEVREAIYALVDALDYSSADEILNPYECGRLLDELSRRYEEIGVCLEYIRLGLYEAQVGTSRLCLVAADFLRGSKLRDEPGIEDVCEIVRETAELVAAMDYR